MAIKTSTTKSEESRYIQYKILQSIIVAHTTLI